MPGQAHTGLGLMHYHRGQHEDAIEQFRRAIELPADDRLYLAHHGLGLVYFQAMEDEKAIAEFTRSLERKGDHSWDFYYRSLASARLRNLSDAKADARQAMALRTWESFDALAPILNGME